MFVLFTDFGVHGPYTGQMEAVLVQGAPSNPIVELMSDVPAFNIGSAGQLLKGLHTEFPADTIFLCIIDPGVGGDRRPIYIKANNQIFIGPDNGLFDPLISKYSNVDAFEIKWRPLNLSNSFHGRDLFAPIATKLFNHEIFDQQVIDTDNLVKGNSFSSEQIIYFDDYGNAWTGMMEKNLPKNAVIAIHQYRIKFQSVFCNTEEGQYFWYYNSSGFVEIACNQASAKETLDLKIGDEFQILI